MGKQWKQWPTLFSWAPKSLLTVTAAMKLSWLLLGRKAMTKIDSILKTRDITFPRKVCKVKAMVFPVIMFGCENWTIRKVGPWRVDAFELWCWRLENPLDTKRVNQSFLKETNSEYSLEGLILKLQYFGHLIWGADSLAKTLILRKIEGRRRRGWQGTRWLDGITDSTDEFEQAPGVGDGQGSLVCWSSWECKESDMTDWLNNKCFLFFFTSWTFPLRFSFFCDKNTPFSCFYERSVGQGHNFFLILLSKNIFFHPQFLKYVNDRFYL